MNPNEPLPRGWLKDWDPNHKAWYYVDTRQNPPQTTWKDPRTDVNQSGSSKGQGRGEAASYYSEPADLSKYQGSTGKGSERGGIGGSVLTALGAAGAGLLAGKIFGMTCYNPYHNFYCI
ncbi:hypothetical protein BY996DRAFT_6414326 [Phakopsora pachyrhizi]|nr:hypothetical protein BY996DRAFT_6418912 [Phakopsora pachyrhizi]KAI8453908.1 hypothetical protein BY996DRAFT_6414326 [Phakopsora pachyrhizi]